MVSKQWYGFGFVFGFVTCAQMLMHAIAHGGSTEESMHRKLTLGEKSFAAPRTRTRLSIALGLSVGRSTNWAISAPDVCNLIRLRLHAVCVHIRTCETLIRECKRPRLRLAESVLCDVTQRETHLVYRKELAVTSGKSPQRQPKKRSLQPQTLETAINQRRNHNEILIIYRCIRFGM